MQKPAILTDEQVEAIRSNSWKKHWRKPGTAAGQGREYENEVISEYRKAGWQVIRNGWPDLACYRENQGVLETQFVECKSGESSVLRYSQEEMHWLLKRMGLDVVVKSKCLTE